MLSQSENPIQPIEGEMVDQQKNNQGGDSTPTNVAQQGQTRPAAPAIVKLDDLKDEKEYSNEEFDQLSKLYEETLSDYVEGEVVMGKILSVGTREVTVDIGFKSEGTIPIEEFSNPEELKVGSDIEVYIDTIEDSEGRLILSKRKVDFIHAWERILASYERGEIIQGKCTRRIKGGIVVDLGGVDAFLPGSQIDVKPIRNFDAYIGQTMDFKVVKVNNLRKNIVVSHRVLLEEEMKEQRQKILDNLAKGQILEGTVKNITDFGVFIDLGGVDGLLHINDLSWGRVSHPSEIVSYDETLKVMVLDFNEEKDRISLGLKQLQPHPWENVPSKYPVGSIVKGKVVNISDYGAFVELEKGVEGLIHISEMSWTQHIKHPSKILAVGEIVEAKVLNVDEAEKKISLGLKQLQPDPWDSLEQKYPVGSRHEGKVRNLTNFGAFVELEEGIDGLIHISDLSWTKKVRHPGEVVKKGDVIEVVVLNVDRQNRRISLGYKQTKENPWDRFETIYKPGTIVKGQIVRLIEKGVIVELPEVVDGFVPMSHLKKNNLTKPADGYKVGDELELCVIEFNKDAKKIVLSERIDHALNVIRQREQGKKIEIETPEELFAEPSAELMPEPELVEPPKSAEPPLGEEHSEQASPSAEAAKPAAAETTKAEASAAEIAKAEPAEPALEASEKPKASRRKKESPTEAASASVPDAEPTPKTAKKKSNKKPKSATSDDVGTEKPTQSQEVSDAPAGN